MKVLLIRIGVLLLSALAIALAAVPILVLLDLLQGGTGFGLCPFGIEACENPYTTAPELVILLTAGLLAVVLGIRLLMRLARHLHAGGRETAGTDGARPSGPR